MGEDQPDSAIGRVNAAFVGFVPHNEALGLEVVAYEEGVAAMRLPYAAHLVGNPETGVLHGGAITSLIDATCGASVYMAMPAAVPIATLELRIDYLRAAPAGHDVVARAECYRLTHNVAFVRAVAYVDDPAAPIASAAATFMLGTAGESALERARRGNP